MRNVVESYSVNVDESHLPLAQQSLVFRLRKRAEIRRQIPGRKSVEEGAPDRIANLLEEAANEIERLNTEVASLEDIIEQMQVELKSRKDIEPN